MYAYEEQRRTQRGKDYDAGGDIGEHADGSGKATAG
jgi:hypothetical protein